MTDLTRRLIELIHRDVNPAADVIDADTDLLLTGTVDSLGVVIIVDWIEDELDVDIPAGDVTLENFLTVQRMVDYVRSRSTG